MRSPQTKAAARRVLNVGAAFDGRRYAKLQRLTSSVFNTFSRDQAKFVSDSSNNWKPDPKQQVVDEIETPLVPINEILAEHFQSGIHFISIDAEGVDFAILHSIDLSLFRPPKVICTEAAKSLADFNHLLVPYGYELLALTPDNVIFGSSTV